MADMITHVAIIRGVTASLYVYFVLCCAVNVHVFTVLLQVYIVTGGLGSPYAPVVLESTETLVRGRAWQRRASLPSARYGVRGLGLDHGRFMITGECWTMLYHHNITPGCTAGGFGHNLVLHTAVLIYDSEEDKWTRVGHLRKARYYHAMSLVPGDTVDHCL